MANTTGKKWGGRQKGTPNKRTEQWNIFAEWMMSDGLVRLKDEMDKLNGREYVNTVKDLMEYFQPKLSRIEQDNNYKTDNIEKLYTILRGIAGIKPKSDQGVGEDDVQGQ